MSLIRNIKQDVQADAGNTSNVNLASGATWAGTPVSTLGVVGLQWNLNTDRNCILYSEESEGSHTGLGTVETDGTITLTGTGTVFERAFVVGDTITVSGETDRIVASITSDTELTVTAAFTNTASGLSFTHYHWDISYHFDFFPYEGRGEGETVQATNAYWRLRVVNVSDSATTYFRVSGILCPIATPLPSALSDDRRLKTESTLSGRENTERHAWINPTNELSVSPVYRMVGTAFDGTNKDPNFWTDGSLRGGTVTQAGGEIELETNTTADGYAAYTSVRQARFVAGSAQFFAGGFSWSTAETADNVRRCGAYSATDGFYFELDNGVFSVGTRFGGVDTLVSSGSFNGNYGLTWKPMTGAGIYYQAAIEFTPMGVFFYINNTRLHSIKAAHLSNTLTLPITIENENTGSSTSDVTFDCVGVYIAREGELHTNPTSKHITTAATYVCKYGAGVLHRIIINNPETGTGMTIYDNISATAPVIAVITLGSKAVAPVSVEYGAPFSTGLTIVSTGTWDVTVVYE